MLLHVPYFQRCGRSKLRTCGSTSLRVTPTTATLETMDRPIGLLCKTCMTARPSLVMIDYSPSTLPAVFEPAPDDLAALPLWTFALGLLALLTFGLTSVPAIICGHRALAETRRSSGEPLGRYVAVTGLVIGYLGAALLGAWIIFLARFLSGH